MLLRELFDVILIRSGQFILSVDEIELDEGKFLTLVKLALGKYNKHRPVDLTFPLQMQGNRNYTFTENFTPKYSTMEYGIPIGVSSVTPTAIAGSPAFSLQFQGAYGLGGYNMRTVQGNRNSPIDPHFGLPGQSQVGGEQMEKSQFPWVFQNNTLTIPYSADVEVVAFFKHPVVRTEATSDTPTTHDFPTIDYDEDVFFDLLQGMFLKALGSSRRAFTIEALPITTDASELASEGQSLEETALEELRTNKSKFYLAFGD